MALTAAQVTRLKTTLNNLIVEYETATASGTISPNYSKGNQSVNFADYLASLEERIKNLSAFLDEEDTSDPANYEVITQVYT